MEQEKTLLSQDFFSNMTYKDLLEKASSDDEKELFAVDKSIREMMDNHFKQPNGKLTYTQLRTILTEIKKTNSLSKSLHKLAYIQARQEKKGAANLVEFIRELMETAIEENKKKAFKNILNTIVAYHKFYGK